MGRSWTLSLAAVVAAVTFTTTTAKAETGRGIDWERLLLDLDHYARYGAERPSPSAHHQAAAALERTHQPYVHNAGNAWFGVAPRVSLVARDWGSAFKIAGDRLSLVDAMRLSSSTRMVMSRVRLGDFGSARVIPFAQLGFGQWRTDAKLLPLTPHATEVASQFGGGVEMNLLSGWQLACETSATLIIRDERGVDDIPQTKLWSATLATRLDW